MEPKWIDWSQRLAAMAHNGLLYTKDPYDRERYEAIRDVAAEMLAEPSGLPASSIHEIFVQETGYATPKVDVRGVAFCDEKILLVKEIADGKWTLPGGWADVGETPAEAVEREVREESGFETKVSKLLAVLDRRKHGHPPHAATSTSSCFGASSPVARPARAWRRRAPRFSRRIASRSCPWEGRRHRRSHDASST